MKTLCGEFTVEIDQRDIGKEEYRRPEIEENMPFPRNIIRIGKEKNDNGGDEQMSKPL